MLSGQLSPVLKRLNISTKDNAAYTYTLVDLHLFLQRGCVI